MFYVTIYVMFTFCTSGWHKMSSTQELKEGKSFINIITSSFVRWDGFSIINDIIFYFKHAKKCLNDKVSPKFDIKKGEKTCPVMSHLLLLPILCKSPLAYCRRLTPHAHRETASKIKSKTGVCTIKNIYIHLMECCW